MEQNVDQSPDGDPRDSINSEAQDVHEVAQESNPSDAVDLPNVRWRRPKTAPKEKPRASVPQQGKQRKGKHLGKDLSNALLWRQFRRHQSQGGSAAGQTVLPMALLQTMLSIPPRQRAMSLPAVMGDPRNAKDKNIKVIACSTIRTSDEVKIRYHLNNPKALKVLETVEREYELKVTRSSDKETTVQFGSPGSAAEHLSIAYQKWADSHLDDYGLLAFHHKDLIAQIQNQVESPYSDFPAADLVPFARMPRGTADLASTVSSLLIDQWQLDPPRVLMTFIGSERNLELPPDLSNVLSEFIRGAASTLTTWFVTKGYHRGLARFVSNALESSSRRAPLIGVSNSSHTDARQGVPKQDERTKNLGRHSNDHVYTKENFRLLLQDSAAYEDIEEERSEARGAVVVMQSAEHVSTPEDGVGYNTQNFLSSKHTHQILLSLDDGERLADKIMSLERHMANVGNVASFGKFGTESPVAVVTMVIKGAVDVIDQCYDRIMHHRRQRRARKQGTEAVQNFGHKNHIVVIAGTGGASEVLAYAHNVKFAHDKGYTEEGLEFMITDELGIHANVGERGEALTQRINFIINYGHKYKLFHVVQPSEVSKSVDILRSIYLKILDDDEMWREPEVDENTPFEQTELEKRLALRRSLRRSHMLEMAMTWRDFKLCKRLLARNHFLHELTLTDDYVKAKPMPGTPMFAQIRMLTHALCQGDEFAEMCVNAMSSEDLRAYLQLKPSTFEEFQPSEVTKHSNTVIELDLFEDNNYIVPYYITKNKEWVAKTANELSHVEFGDSKGRRLISRFFRRSFLLPNRVHPDNEDIQKKEEKLLKLEREAVLRYFLKMLLSAGVNLALSETKAADDNPPDLISKAIKLIAKTLHHAWILSQDTETELTVPFDFLNDEAKKERLENATSIWDIMEKNGLVIWEANSYEQLFLHALPFNKSKQSHETSADYLVEIFPRGRSTTLDIISKMKKFIGTSEAPFDMKPSTFEGLSPYFRLLVWAVFTNRQSLIKYFWDLDLDSSIPHALVGAAICSNVLNVPTLAPEMRMQFERHIRFFVNSATDVLRICSAANARFTVDLLEAAPESTGGVPAWYLAYLVKAKEITASDTYQKVIGSQWYGFISSQNSSFKILLGIIFPPYVCFWISKKYTFKAIAALGVDMDHKGFLKASGKAKKPGLMTLIRLRLYHFYQAPIATFYFELLSYLAFAVLYSYATLIPPAPLSDVANLSTEENQIHATTMIWIVVLIVTEVEQVVTEGGFGKWWSSYWNRWDALMYTIMIIAYIIRVDSTSEMLVVSSMFSGTAAWLLWMRLTRFFSFNEILGPKLYMMGYMIKDIFVFLALLALILVGYGVASLAVLQPTRGIGEDVSFLFEMFLRPVFQAFGDTFLDQVEEESTCLGSGFTSCTRNIYWGLFLLVCYLLIANVLLVNLLIAMMSSTYEKVSEESRQIWSIQNLDLLKEFRIKNFLPAPFSVFTSLYRITLGVFVRDISGNEVQTKPWNSDLHGAFLSARTIEHRSDSKLELETLAANQKEFRTILRELQHSVGVMGAELVSLRQETLGTERISKYDGFRTRSSTSVFGEARSPSPWRLSRRTDTFNEPIPPDELH